jgi:outer membrane protein assembly factor BamB
MNLSDAGARFAKRAALCLTAALLVACAGGSDKAKPAELITNSPKLGVRLAWTTRIDAVNFPLDIAVNSVNTISNATIIVANGDGVVINFDAASGRQLWRAQAGKTLAAGVGSDAGFAAVVTTANELITFDNGREVWRQKLGTSSYTAPLVAGGKVFVLGSDRAISAFELADGKKLWSQKKSTEALTLRQSGVLLMVSETLVSSASGRLLGINPLDGNVRWSTPIATARGTNEIERLVDLVGRVSKSGDVVCARAYRISVGCVNTLRGNLVWAKPAVGLEGVQDDTRTLFGSESDGKVIAWNRVNGERLWQTEQLLNRNLSAPAVLDKAIAVGDSSGFLHFLSKTDGSPLNRVATDGSAMAAAPVVVGATLVVVTRNGGVFGFVAE